MSVNFLYNAQQQTLAESDFSKSAYMGGEKMVKTKTDIYSRIVGYLRPVRDWNEGKFEEFNDRKTFCVNEDSK